MLRKYAKLDVVPGGEPQRFHISEGDDRSRNLVFSLFASEGELEIPSGARPYLECKKPDGSKVTFAGTQNNLAVTFDLPASVAEAPGNASCNVVLISGDKRLYTEAFILVIDKDTQKEE